MYRAPSASESAENVAVTHFALASGTLRKGSMARCIAEVRNFGRTSLAEVKSKLEELGLSLGMEPTAEGVGAE